MTSLDSRDWLLNKVNMKAKPKGKLPEAKLAELDKDTLQSYIARKKLI